MENLFDMKLFSAEALSNDTISFIAWYDDGRIVTCNPPFVELTGYATDELDSMEWPCDFAPPKTCELITKSIDSLKRGLKAYRHEGIITRKDSTTVPIEMYVHRHNDAAGKFLFYYSFITDISSRKRVEEALLASKAQAELYLDLMAHDINNLNQTTLGCLELALESAHDPGEKELMSRALEATKNSSQLIANVRKLRQIQEHELKCEPVRLCKLLTEIKSEYEGMHVKHVSINLTPACECVVNANNLLKDVFVNLVGNAVKHSTGPVTVDIIMLDLFEDGTHFCKVIVQDNGPGIPDKLKSKLFTRLRSGPKKATGWGLGLYLSKVLVNDFGGRIWVEDRVPGDHTKGARFVVVLPASDN